MYQTFCWPLNRGDEMKRELWSAWTKGGCGRVAWRRFHFQFYSRIIFGLWILCSRLKGKCFLKNCRLWQNFSRLSLITAFSLLSTSSSSPYVKPFFRFKDSDLRERVKLRRASILGLLLTVLRTNNIPLTQDEYVANPETNCNSEH